MQEHSYGIIPLQRGEGEWQVLLVKHGKGHWAFPKGHPEVGEGSRDAAIRELYEETGLRVLSFLDFPPQEENYSFYKGGHLIDKIVTYFLAEVAGNVSIQEEEIADYKWISVEKAHEMTTFSEGKTLCLKIATLLST